MKAREFLLAALDLVLKRQLCPDSTVMEWSKALLKLHEKGWLYAIIRDGKLRALWAAYRIPFWDEKFSESIPEEEKGQIFYVPFLVTDGEEKNAPLRAFKDYRRRNPDVKEIIFYKRNSDTDLRRYRLNSRGKCGVQEESSYSLSSST